MKKVKRINLVFLATVLCYILASLFLSNVGSKLNIGTITRIIISQLVLGLPMLVYLFSTKEPIRETLRLNKVKVGTFFLMILFALLMVPLMGFLNGLSMLFTENTISQTMASMSNQYPYLLSILVLAFIPCVMEEMVYRGVFFNEYRKINRRFGILLSGLLFGLMHMNLNQFIYAFVMGMIFAIAVEVTNSLLASMVMHFTFNALSTTLIYLLGLLNKLMGNQIPQVNDTLSTLNSPAGYAVIAFYGVLAIFGLVLGGLVLYAVANIEGRKEQLISLIRPSKSGQKEYRARQLISIPLIIGIVICILLIIRFQLL